MLAPGFGVDPHVAVAHRCSMAPSFRRAEPSSSRRISGVSVRGAYTSRILKGEKASGIAGAAGAVKIGS
jgi:hypothetical protein